jgi:hypothetical protein
MKKILLFLTVISFNLCSYAGYVKINAQNYNLQGKLLFTQDIVDETTSIDISSYAEGMYLFKIQNNQQHIKTLKVIINR